MKILDKSLKIASQLHEQNAGHQQQKLYAFIYDRNTLISVGQNCMNHQTKKALYFGKRFNVQHFIDYPYIHAEISAISRLWGKRYITGKEKLVVVRFGARGDLRLAKPCSNCQTILSALNIKNIHYTSENGWLCS